MSQNQKRKENDDDDEDEEDDKKRWLGIRGNMEEEDRLRRCEDMWVFPFWNNGGPYGRE